MWSSPLASFVQEYQNIYITFKNVTLAELKFIEINLGEGEEFWGWTNHFCWPDGDLSSQSILLPDIASQMSLGSMKGTCHPLLFASQQAVDLEVYCLWTWRSNLAASNSHRWPHPSWMSLIFLLRSSTILSGKGKKWPEVLPVSWSGICFATWVRVLCYFLSQQSIVNHLNAQIMYLQNLVWIWKGLCCTLLYWLQKCVSPFPPPLLPSPLRIIVSSNPVLEWFYSFNSCFPSFGQR